VVVSVVLPVLAGLISLLLAPLDVLLALRLALILPGFALLGGS
jgi:hypothetical protein